MALLVALALLVPGCSRSVLIRRDDLTYRRAIDHFKRTRQVAAVSLAPEDDQAIFIQAEGLFRYRFAPPGRSVGSYLARIAASLIDLPVLDSLAGSLDLDLLRLRASDGAVQLWESLLARNPSTPLRPLTLYRLGWAYRNSIASDFPGTSEQAFDEIMSNYHDSPVAPFAAEARRHYSHERLLELLSGRAACRARVQRAPRSGVRGQSPCGTLSHPKRSDWVPTRERRAKTLQDRHVLGRSIGSVHVRKHRASEPVYM